MAIDTNGLLLPTTPVIDVTSLEGKTLSSPEFRELLVRLYQQLGLIAVSSNQKDIGAYLQTEGYNGQLWFADPTLTTSADTPARPRPVVRKVINMGALLNAAPTTVAHGIAPTATYSFTRIYATATDPLGNYIPIPFVAVSAAGLVWGDIEIRVTATNVIITPVANASNFTICYAVLEYITN